MMNMSPKHAAIKRMMHLLNTEFLGKGLGEESTEDPIDKKLEQGTAMEEEEHGGLGHEMAKKIAGDHLAENPHEYEHSVGDHIKEDGVEGEDRPGRKLFSMSEVMHGKFAKPSGLHETSIEAETHLPQKNSQSFDFHDKKKAFGSKKKAY